MSARKQKPELTTLYNLLAEVDLSYEHLPQRMRLEIEKISQGMSEFGPRKLGRRGQGMEFFEARDFRPDSDDPKHIHARLSARRGRNVVVENEAEIMQHIYLWRDPSASMDYKSAEEVYSKKQAAEIMLLSLAKHLSKNEELVGILDKKGGFRGGKAAQAIAHQLLDVSVISGDVPNLERKLPANSTVVMFSDFLMDKQELINTLGEIQGNKLSGYLVMVVDPNEISFDFKGHIRFNGLEGEGSKSFKKAESMKAEYHKKMAAHIEWVADIAREKGFDFILQKTDEPLHEGLLALYGLSDKIKPGAYASPAIDN